MREMREKKTPSPMNLCTKYIIIPNKIQRLSILSQSKSTWLGNLNTTLISTRNPRG